MLRVRSRSALWACTIVAGSVLALGAACSAGKSGGEEPGAGASGSGASGGAAGSGAGAGGQAGDGGAAAAGAVGGFGGTANGGSWSAGGAAGAGATSGGSAGSGASTGDADVPDVTFSYDAPIVEQEACANTKVEAQLIPLDMYIILDMSGSMHDPQFPGFGDCDVGQGVDSKWCHSINALHGFFSAATSVGMSVALQFFSGASCTALSSPAVPLQILPAHLAQLQSAMNGINPNGGTPTGSAASGIAAFTGANQQPGRKMIGILITDGDPTSCGDATAVGLTLSTHFTNTGIPTFVIGMDGASFGNLEAMAGAAGSAPHTTYCGGGITPCHFYNVGNGDPNAFIDALKAIQGSALGCEFLMPTTDAGIINPSDVKVIYTPGGGGPQELPNVPNAGACGANDGWYFDNPATPTKIFLCPTTCAKVQADANAKIDIELGCLGS